MVGVLLPGDLDRTEAKRNVRLVFVGASATSVMAARSLTESGHEVVLIEDNRERIDELEEDLDCSFLCGDGGKPAVLREVDPQATDILFCLTDDDHVNIIASLVGRSLGFKKVVSSIEDPEYEVICRELGLENVIVPAQTISRHLQDMVNGIDCVELSTLLKDRARFFTFELPKDDEGTVEDLKLPENARLVYYYRGGKFSFADADTRLRAGDEVVILAYAEVLPTLNERWSPQQA